MIYVNFGSVFVSGQPTSGINPSSGSVCTVGKLSSVDVHVTSTFARGRFFRTEVGCPETKTDP